MKFSENDRVLLIGDSITDCGRREDPEKVGYGYVRMIRDHYITTEPTGKIQIINKGIGGDRVTDLANRWKEDVIAEQPDWVSISIGINDVWRQLDSTNVDQVFPDVFEEIYTDLLSQIANETNARIILMEPTIIEEDVQSPGNKKLIPYIETVHRLAEKYDAILVPTHQAFKQFLQHNSEDELTTDGVHMTSIGNLLMAQTWIKAIEEA